MTTETLPHAYPELEAPRETPRRRASTGGAGSQLSGMLWFAGWLFTIAFAKLVWWKALLALVIWPYFLGDTIR